MDRIRGIGVQRSGGSSRPERQEEEEGQDEGAEAADSAGGAAGAAARTLPAVRRRLRPPHADGSSTPTLAAERKEAAEATESDAEAEGAEGEEEDEELEGDSGLSLSPPSSHSSSRFRLTLPSQARLHQLGSAISVSYAVAAGLRSDTDWLGIYPIDTQSAPGLSEGMWRYLPNADCGTVTFPAALTPKAAGVYEIRYHSRNRYTVRAAVPIIITALGGRQPAEQETKAALS